MKLRVSLMAQSTMTALRDREDLTPEATRQLRADASELCYIKSQPTADEIILRSIGVLPQPALSNLSGPTLERERARVDG